MGSLPHGGVASVEDDFLASLHARYEQIGFDFIRQPSEQELPPFLRGFRPDAIARKSGRNVVIEIKRGRSSGNEKSLLALRRVLADQKDWELQLFFVGDDPYQDTQISATPAAEVGSGVAEVRRLSDAGHGRAALLLAWSLLEASLRAYPGEQHSKPRGPAAVVEKLGMLGLIEPDLVQPLLSLVNLRNRLVHGDWTVEPTRADVDVILRAVESALGAINEGQPEP